MPEFHETGMGRKFFESTLPKIAKQLERMTEILERSMSSSPDMAFASREVERARNSAQEKLRDPAYMSGYMKEGVRSFNALARLPIPLPEQVIEILEARYDVGFRRESIYVRARAIHSGQVNDVLVYEEDQYEASRWTQEERIVAARWQGLVEVNR